MATFQLSITFFAVHHQVELRLKQKNNMFFDFGYMASSDQNGPLSFMN